jgi:hypothetical protein
MLSSDQRQTETDRQTGAKNACMHTKMHLLAIDRSTQMKITVIIKRSVKDTYSLTSSMTTTIVFSRPLVQKAFLRY